MLVVAFLGVAIGSAAAAAWTAPRIISPGGAWAETPSVELDGQGNALFAWDHFDGTTPTIVARRRSASGVLGEVEEVARVGKTPELGVAPNGFAAFIWIAQDATTSNLVVRGRIRTPTGVLRKTHTLSLPGNQVDDSYLPRVAVDNKGNAVFAWVIEDGSARFIQTRALSTLGDLSPIQDVTPAGGLAVDPRVAVDADGDAVLAWVDANTPSIRIAARTRSRTGPLSATRFVSPARTDGLFEPDVAVDADGNALVTWKWFDGEDDVIQARARSITGSLGPIETLTSGGQDASHPKVGVDADGDALFAWDRSDGEVSDGVVDEECCERVQARFRSSTGVLGATKTLSSDGVRSTFPAVAVNTVGEGIVGWVRHGLDGLRIQVVARSARGVFGEVATISPGSKTFFARPPDVAIDPDGDTAAAWQRDDETGYTRLHASFGS